MRHIGAYISEGLIGSRTRNLKNADEIIDSWTDAIIAGIDDLYTHDDLRGPHNEAVYGLYSLLSQEAGRRGVEMIQGKAVDENGRDWKDKIIIIFYRNTQWKKDINPMKLVLIMGAAPARETICSFINMASYDPVWICGDPAGLPGMRRTEGQLRCTDDDKYIPFEITSQSSLFESLRHMITRIMKESKYAR